MILPRPGDVIGEKYRLERVLGEGGFGRVFSATTIGIERPVAVKVLKQASDSKHAKRFLNEVRIIAQLQHPNTLTLFDFGETATGMLYMVSELVPGEDLKTLMVSGRRFTDGEVVHIVAQIMGSLSEAHTAGVLHRDIKPDNIRIYPWQDDPLTVKVLDFGIAKLLDDSGPQLTATGKAIGTPRYMSPEQLYGTPLTPASDVYSVGLVGFEMLLGLDGRKASDLVSGDAPHISVADPVDPGLRQIVNRMLARDANDRYASADSVIGDLRSLKRGWEESREAAEAMGGRNPDLIQTRKVIGRRVRAPQSSEERSPPPGRLTGVHLVAGVGGLVFVALAIVLALPSDQPARRSSPAVQNAGTSALIKRSHADAGAFVDAEPESQVDLGEEVATGGLSGCRRAPTFTGFGELNGMDLPMSVYVPDSYDPKRRYPVLMIAAITAYAPPDKSSKAASLRDQRSRFMRESGLPEAAEKHQVILVAPDIRNQGTVSRRRQAFEFEDALEVTAATFCVDRGRVFILGHRDGGSWIDAALCEPWVAAGAYSSYIQYPRARFQTGRKLPKAGGCRSGPAKPLLLLSPTKTPSRTGSSRCTDETATPLRDIERPWRERNGCTAEPSDYFTYNENTCRTWSCEAPLVSCRLDGGPGWPGTSPEMELFRCDVEAADFPSAEVLLSFFETVPPVPTRARHRREP